MAYSNTMRYTGLSGIDTASIVENLMKVEGMKYDSLYKKNTKEIYKQQAYQSVGNKLYATQKEKFDPLAANSLRKSSTFSSTKTTVKDSSGNDSSAISVKLGTGVTNLNQELSVDQLAKKESVSFRGNGYDASTTNGSSSAKDYLGGATEFNGVAIDDTMTIDQFVKAYNSAGNDGTMSFSSLSGAITIKGSATGADNALSLGGGTDSAAYISSFGNVTSHTKAQDALITVDGAQISSSSNTFTLTNGSTITANAVTDGPITIKTEKDKDACATAIKSFVETYNSLLSTIYEETKTTRPTSSKGSTYEPLTEEESAEMSETEIEKWEANAKKGLLYKDDDLKAIERQLRDAVSNGVKLSDGSTVRLSDLGITLNDDYAKGGLLSINEEKLNEGIERLGTDKIANAFTNTTDGFSTRINTVLKDTVGSMGSLTEKVGLDSSALYKVDNTMSQQIKRNQQKLEELYDRLAKKEERYYKMFAAMEESVTKSNSQLSALGLG